MAVNTNFNDPLYIHPSDTPVTNLINDQLIGVENYGIWSRAMLIALRAKNKIALIDGSCRRPPVGSQNSLQWERRNALVLAWLMNTVSKEIYGGIIYTSDASTVWADLKEQFDKVNGSRIFSLHREISSLTQGNNTVSAYYCKLKQLWDEYSVLFILPSCDCDAAKTYLEHDQQQKLLQFLMRLNDSYANARSQILMMSPLPIVGQAFSLISQEESHRALFSVEAPIAALYTNQSKGGNLVREKSNLFCEYCNWNGHTKENCFKLVGYPLWHKLHKASHKDSNNKKGSKDDWKMKKPLGDANMVDTRNVALKESDTTGAPPIFSTDQYAEILKFLGNNKVQNEFDLVVNMAGPQDWKSNGDW